MSKQEDLGTVETLEQIINLVADKSGYPNNTIAGGGAAFAYGLAVGSLIWLKREWEERLTESGRKGSDDGRAVG